MRIINGFDAKCIFTTVMDLYNVGTVVSRIFGPYNLTILMAAETQIVNADGVKEGLISGFSSKMRDFRQVIRFCVRTVMRLNEQSGWNINRPTHVYKRIDDGLLHPRQD